MKTYEIGDVVYVLCKHRDWGTPSLIKTSVSAVVMSNDQIPRFNALLDTERVVEVFQENSRNAAEYAYEEAVRQHAVLKGDDA